MNYKLVKKLKDTGFPQKRTGKYFALGGEYEYPIIPCKEEYETVSIPTLSELIEACGDDFESLVLENYPKGNKYWKAYQTDESYKGDCVVDCCGYESGDTAEEAVANLWLELNKDSNPRP